MFLTNERGSVTFISDSDDRHFGTESVLCRMVTESLDARIVADWFRIGLILKYRLYLAI
jgi:hypothetical protein